MSIFALVGAQIFDGSTLIDDHAVLTDGASVQVLPAADVPQGCASKSLEGGILMPGFVDLQVNGGGGLMFNADPSLATLETMAAAHRSLGTRAFLPTLITDTREKTASAIAAVQAAITAGVPGILGLHLEGPHLSVARKGAHDASLIRPMHDDDLTVLLAAAGTLPNLMITLAPESVTLAQITTLTQAGVIVSLGHSDTDYDTAQRAFEAGAHCTTHLFNAMSQLGSRAPGLVGATLDNRSASAGLIADAIHVHPATIRMALAAKRGPGEIFLVTDAMACAGSDMTEFTLNDRKITRARGRLQLQDGTLAGADLSMARALEVMVQDVGDTPERAFARATSIPAGLLSDARGYGAWPDKLSDVIYLGPEFSTSAATDLL